MEKQSFMILIGSLKKGGAERNAALLSNWLVQNGHDVNVVLFVRDIAFDLDSRVKLIQINHKKFSSSGLNALYAIYKLRRLLKEINPKRLIAMSRVGSLIAASTIFSKTIVRFDIYPLIGYKRYKQWQFWFYYNLPWVKYVVCPSQELKQDVALYFRNKAKLVTIYNPLPTVTPMHGTAEKQNRRPYFIIVSRLHQQKNINRVIETFVAMGLHNKTDLLIYGDGPQRKQLEDLILSLDVSDSVRLMGFVRDPHPYMKCAICLINASIREGFPNVVVESLTLGTPVISSAAKTGPKEIIFEGENGFLFPVADYGALGKRMNQLVEDKDLYHYLKMNTSKGLDRFTHEKVMASWMEILMN